MNRGIETAVRIPLDTPGQSKLLRGVIAVIGIAAWFFTQSLLASQGFPQGIDDRLHILLSPLTQWLAHHDNPANLLLIVTSAVIDALGCYLLFSGVMSSTVRPLLGLGAALCPPPTLPSAHRFAATAANDMAQPRVSFAPSYLSDRQ